jgi:hypothetical protein
VSRGGQKYVIPEGVKLQEASEFLQMMSEEEEQPTTFVRIFDARPWDGAYCAFKAMKEVFGAVAHKGKRVMFWMEPPRMISIPVGPGEKQQVPWGEFSVATLDGCQITFEDTEDAEKGQLFVIVVNGPKKFQAEIEGLFNLIEAACKEYSIYKGKAIEGMQKPDFISVEIDPKKVVYSESVTVQMEANVWSVIQDMELQREAELPLKRSILLHGPYGAGKSLFLGLTAKRAVESGWTFIRCRPKDSYLEVLQMAALYAPAVVAFEDVDTLAGVNSTATDVAQLLDAFDGVTAKGIEIVALLTTNHPEKIHKGMVRPGRLDAVIEIAALDEPGVRSLVTALVPETMLAKQVNWKQVHQSMDGFMPAFIVEATGRAIRYALSRSKKIEGTLIDTEDLVNAANGLRPQLELMENAEEHGKYVPTLDQAMRDAVAQVVTEVYHDGAEFRPAVR